MKTQCIVRRIASVEPHPVAERPDLNVLKTADGVQFVSQKCDDGTGALTVPRYSVDDLVVHLPHGCMLSPALQERLGAREAKIRAGNFVTVRSEGMLMPLAEVAPGAAEGDDVAAHLDILS